MAPSTSAGSPAAAQPAGTQKIMPHPAADRNIAVAANAAAPMSAAMTQRPINLNMFIL